jgi:carboxylesterase
MIHGLGGSRHDFGSLDKTFEQAGCDVYLPRLPGHGSCPDQLRSVSLGDYMRELLRTYRALATRYARVDIAGISMGALLALMLCARGDVRAGRLILLSPPIFIDGWGVPRLNPLRYLLYCVPGLRNLIRVPENEPFGIKNTRIRGLLRRHLQRGSGVHYAYVPLGAVAQVDWMRFAARRALRLVRCPTLVMHSEEDEITSIRSAHFVCDRLGTRDVTLVRLTDSYHMITLDNERETVAERTLAFMRASEPSEPRAGRVRAQAA